MLPLLDDNTKVETDLFVMMLVLPKPKNHPQILTHTTRHRIF